MLFSGRAASHGRGALASTRLSIRTGDQQNRVLSPSDDDGRAAEYRSDRTVTRTPDDVSPLWGAIPRG